jgi:hypothetical protein
VYYILGHYPIITHPDGRILLSGEDETPRQLLCHKRVVAACAPWAAGNLRGAAGAAGAAGGPELPGLATPVVHVDGCGKMTRREI